jgi:hypothetical protein
MFGELIITVNGEKIRYKKEKLGNNGRNFAVDSRYQIEIDNIKAFESDTIIECALANENIELCGYAESGENLELISFICDNTKLSMGVEGDIPGFYYEYMQNGLRVRITNSATRDTIIFLVAWLTMNNKEVEEIHTWFAADPTLSS